MVALMAAVAVMLIMMTAALPSWRYVMKNDKEEELIAHGGEIADAIGRFQKKSGNALPPSLEVLVKGKFLRHPYKDPMTKSGRWRFIRPGEAMGPVQAPSPFGSATTTTTTTRPSAFAQPGMTLGGIQGVASTSTERSLRIFNGRTHYNEWLFIPGQPRIVGRTPGPAVPGQVVPPGTRPPGAGLPGTGPVPPGPTRP